MSRKWNETLGKDWGAAEITVRKNDVVTIDGLTKIEYVDLGLLNEMCIIGGEYVYMNVDLFAPRGDQAGRVLDKASTPVRLRIPIILFHWVFKQYQEGIPCCGERPGCDERSSEHAEDDQIEVTGM